MALVADCLILVASYIYMCHTGMQYMNCALEKVENVNYNTKVFAFKLPGASRMIVPTGHHISIKAKDKQGS